MSGTYFIAIFREHPLNHGPAHTQPLAHEDGIDREVDDEEAAEEDQENDEDNEDNADAEEEAEEDVDMD